MCPEEPAAVLALSRMVAVDRSDRRLRHISKPLRHQMMRMIDRGRWPVLITYHDEGQGHTGHVYKCSGWTLANAGLSRAYYVDGNGRRKSPYAGGGDVRARLEVGGATRVHRWEHRVCGLGEAAAWLKDRDWRRVAIPGKVWKSGGQAHRWVKIEEAATDLS